MIAEISRFSTRRSAVLSGVMLPKSEKVLLALQDHSLEIWDVRKGRRDQIFSENVVYPSNIGLNDMTVSADSGFAALSWDWETCEVWNLATGECTEVCSHHHQVFSAVVLSGGRRLLSIGDEEEIVRVWDLRENKGVAAIPVARGHLGWLEKLILLPDDRLLFVSWNNTVGIWDIPTGGLHGALSGHRGHISCLAVDEHGSRALSGSADTTLRLWDLSDGTCVRVMESHEHTIKSVAIGADGDLAASLDQCGTLRIWDIRTGKWLGSTKTNANLVGFVGRGEQILLADGNDLVVYQVRC